MKRLAASAALVLTMALAGPAAAFDNRGLTCTWNVHFRTVVGMTCTGTFRHVTLPGRVAVWR